MCMLHVRVKIWTLDPHVPGYRLSRGQALTLAQAFALVRTLPLVRAPELVSTLTLALLRHANKKIRSRNRDRDQITR